MSEQELYAKGRLQGRMDRAMNLQAAGSRRWPIAYRNGYSDGYCSFDRTY
jgi:hypothetical protein